MVKQNVAPLSGKSCPKDHYYGDELQILTVVGLFHGTVMIVLETKLVRLYSAFANDISNMC
jgi:hypothetical protein